MKWLHIIVLSTAAVFIFGCYIVSAYRSRSNPIGKPVRRLLLSASLAIGVNVVSMMTKTLFAASVGFGIYNSLINCMLVCLVLFARQFTGLAPRVKKEYPILCTAAVIDSFLMMIINPFIPITYRIAEAEDQFGSSFHYISEFGFFYIVHILFVIACISLTVWILTKKTSLSPEIYKFKYASIVTAICFVVSAHTLYMKLGLAVDFSLLFYAGVSLVIFYFSLIYVPRGLMERFLFFTIANMKDGIICLDIDGKCVHANKPAKIYCDAESDRSAVDRQIERWFSQNIPEDRTETGWEAERRISGVQRKYYIEYRRIFDYRNKYLGCFFILNDNTEAYERLSAETYRATHDSLTGIYNMEYFCEMAEQAIKSEPDKQFYVICTDVKNFKLINDIFGIETGDNLLKYIARSISVIGGTRCVYGRISSDRFAICLKEEYFSEKLLLREAEKIASFIGAAIFKIHIHFGVFKVTDRGLRVSVMCDRANLAIKTIKNSYSNVVAYYSSDLRESFLDEQKIISAFEGAVVSGQFKAYIQPQIAANGKVLGGEALVRWHHATEGMVPPGKFIGVLEKSGLISRLDKYMWEEVCILLKKWKDSGRDDFYISINISNKDFFLMDVYETLTSLIAKYSLDPKNLHLEITETAIMNNPAVQIPLIGRLREYGFIVEIDDFGSGYSSLNTLKDIRADVLKVDMGFLRNAENDQRSINILKMIISLAKMLDMKVITEGVETREQVEFLTEFGCDVFQGYYFAKPMRVSEFEEKYMSEMVKI